MTDIEVSIPINGFSIIKKYKIKRDSPVWLGLNPNPIYGVSPIDPSSPNYNYLKLVGTQKSSEDMMTTSMATRHATAGDWLDLLQAQDEFNFVNGLFNVLSDSEKNGSNLATLTNVTNNLNNANIQRQLSKGHKLVPGVFMPVGEI